MSGIDDYEASFEAWEHRTRMALGDRGIGYHEATPLIEEAREHHAASGEPDAREALGTPEQFAADVAAAHPELTVGRDTQGKTPVDHLTDGLFVLAWNGILVALLGAWVNRGLTIPLTIAGVAGTVLVGVAFFVVAAVPGALRAAGHPRLAPWGFVGGVVLAFVAAAAFGYLPKTRIGELPVLLLLGVSLFACWYLTHPGAAPAAGPNRRPAAPDPAEPDAWFARLKSVLVGRFDLPAERAAELVAETRAHVTEAGVVPSAEFPSLDGYARELAEGEPTRRGPWWRGPAAALLGTLLVVAWGTYSVAEAVVERRWGPVICGLLAAPLAVAVIRRRYRAWAATRPRPAGS